MSPARLRSLPGLPRKLYRRSQALRQQREERRFRTRLRPDQDAPELLLSPHWDDAVLDCFALLDSERELKVVNVFAGVPSPGKLTPWDAITGATDSAARARERIAEDTVALARTGRQPVNLALLDAQYRADPQALRLHELDSALAAEVPVASRLYVPAGIGAHPDHVFVRRYGRMLLRFGMPVTLYADLPYCIFHGWPHWVDGEDRDPARNVNAYWELFLGAVEEMPPLESAEIVHLDEARRQAKLAAMRCYRTQYPSLNYGARVVLGDPAIHGFEVRWELRPRGPQPHCAAA